MPEMPDPHHDRDATPMEHARRPTLIGRLFNVFLNFVEWLGNLLPHPVTLFAIICVLIPILSAVASAAGLQVPDPRPKDSPDYAPGGTIEAVSLLTAEGFRWLSTNVVDNFVSFAPLGTVLVALLGVGVADRSGLISAGIRLLVLGAPRQLIVTAIVFAAVLSNTASEMGYIVLIPLAASIFYSLGRNPLTGLAVAFAGVSGGYSANLLLGTIDPLLAGITQENAQLIAPTYEVNPTANWYFMIVSTFMITIVGTLVTLFITEPRLGKYDESRASENLDDIRTIEPLTGREKRGLLIAFIATLVLIGIVAALAHPNIGFYRNPDVAEGAPWTDTLKPLLNSIVTLIFVFFLIPGIVYGVVTGTIRSDRDVIDGMAGAMKTLGLYLVLVFFAAQFVEMFDFTNLGTITAVLGAEFLQWLGLDNMWVFIPFIFVSGFINLMIGSASGQWAVTAPIFVPMLMLTGYSPEVIQAAYRIGDSVTNIITPMMSYFGLILAFAARYDKNIGIGTLVAAMLPYSLCFLAGWIVLFYVWVFALGLPVGPGAPTAFPG